MLSSDTLEMLSDGTLRKVKSATKACKLSTVGSKKDCKKFCKIFLKIWGRSEGWPSFSCLQGVVYYLKFCYNLKVRVIDG